MADTKSTIPFPSPPSLVHRAKSEDSNSDSNSEVIQTPKIGLELGRFETNFGGETGVTIQDVYRFIKYTLFSDPKISNFEFVPTYKLTWFEPVPAWKISPLLRNTDLGKPCAIRMSLIEVETLVRVLWADMDLDCEEKCTTMSRFPQGLSVYTITKGRKIEEPLPPLKRTFGCLALQQFPKSPTEFFRPDWMDEEEEAALEAASKKAEEERNIDLLYF